MAFATIDLTVLSHCLSSGGMSPKWIAPSYIEPSRRLWWFQLRSPREVVFVRVDSFCSFLVTSWLRWLWSKFALFKNRDLIFRQAVNCPIWNTWVILILNKTDNLQVFPDHWKDNEREFGMDFTFSKWNIPRKSVLARGRIYLFRGRAGRGKWILVFFHQ